MNAPMKMPPAVVPEDGDGAQQLALLDPLETPQEQAPPVVDDPAEEAKRSGFDWFRDSSIVVEDQPSVAVYVNTRSAIVIRAESRSGDEDDDAVIILSTKQAVSAVIDALKRELKDMRDG